MIALRWSHLVVFLLVFPEFFGDIKELNKLRLYKNTLDEKEKEEMLHSKKLRDYEKQNFWMLIQKCTETLQIFVYQACVFYAQWTVVYYKKEFIPD